MRTALLLALGLLIAGFAEAQPGNLKLLTWNVRDLGRSKSDLEIELMAHVLRDYDVIALQEVVAKDPAGARAVARLDAALDRLGANYDYRVSDPTRSSSAHVRERYAFLWRTDKLKLVSRPHLLSAFAKTIEREPYLAEFAWGDKRFRVANLHARPHDQHPEQELAQLRELPDVYADAPFFLVGDFNLVSRHSVFVPWQRRGYRLAVENQKTTLRRKLPCPDDDCYAREKDNILVPAHQVQQLEGGTLDLLAFFRGDLAAANTLSDHVPVYVIFDDFPQLDREP